MASSQRRPQSPKEKELRASTKSALKSDKPHLVLRIGRAKAVIKKCNFKAKRLSVRPAKFRTDFNGLSVMVAPDDISRFFHPLLPVPNSVVIRRSLDKFCLEKGQSRN